MQKIICSNVIIIILGTVNMGKIANINTSMNCVQNRSVGMRNVNLDILNLASLIASVNFSKGNFVFISILLMMINKLRLKLCQAQV